MVAGCRPGGASTSGSSQIVREEMNAIGGQEMLMPVMHPAEPWRRTGRYEIEELFKLKDRKGADMVLAMTHEEIVTGHVAAAVQSYRELPLTLYHFQVKERDEPRPRAGVLRTREFIMKDSYTFDRDREGLDVAYEKHARAYDRMMDTLRAGVVPGRGGRRDDGGPRRATSTWRHARPARTRSCSRRATRPTSRSRAPTRSPSRCRRRSTRRSSSRRPG